MHRFMRGHNGHSAPEQAAEWLTRNQFSVMISRENTFSQ
ncbi:hypothetical protein L910_4159 [Vibrio fluvialis PG41]|uniref:Uncharacterized protein n=1 Tax=Vibrio fluvialis PG41 TaxID=1336752 RepID=S7JG81_VIBFL|nr:hypothetical protein L910_4159 [Vibrio fluvialis PG41]